MSSAAIQIVGCRFVRNAFKTTSGSHEKKRGVTQIFLGIVLLYTYTFARVCSVHPWISCSTDFRRVMLCNVFSSTFVCSFVFVFPNVTASAAGCSAEFSGGEMQRWVCEGQPSAQAWDRITPLALMLITLPLVLYPTSYTLFSSPLVFYSHHPTSRTCITVISLAYSSLVS